MDDESIILKFLERNYEVVSDREGLRVEERETGIKIPVREFIPVAISILGDYAFED